VNLLMSYFLYDKDRSQKRSISKNRFHVFNFDRELREIRNVNFEVRRVCNVVWLMFS
jgi:hypothetical protein